MSIILVAFLPSDRLGAFSMTPQNEGINWFFRRSKFLKKSTGQRNFFLRFIFGWNEILLENSVAEISPRNL